MRLFGKVDGKVDRYDRAVWITPPFDMEWTPRVPVHVSPVHATDIPILSWEELPSSSPDLNDITARLLQTQDYIVETQVHAERSMPGSPGKPIRG